jgi:hypothetical protein
MIAAIATAQHGNPTPRRTSYGAAVAASILCLCFVGLLTVEPAGAAVTITLAGGVQNPPPSVTSGVPEKAIADKATLVPVANFSGILQSVLDAQGFTNANHWSLVTNAAPLNENEIFNITDYHLFKNGGNTAFGENMDFTLAHNLARPADVPMGSTATLHWLQMLNEDKKYNGFGYAITGQQGFWQLDNGDIAGGAAAGAGTGPYYDSNSMGGFSLPPGFHDAPQFYSGIGSYLHFTAIPTWDIFTPAMGTTPASESINVGNFGLAWGFVIVPETSTFMLIVIAWASISAIRRRKYMPLTS